MKNLEEILKDVEKPGRYLGGEWNQIKKDPSSVQTKVALVFPDLYEVGMSYLGQKILYSLLNDNPKILAERVFAPWIDFEQKLRSEKIPLYSLENKIPLDEFDILGFSLLYELNYSNILTILDLARIPVFSSDRSLDHPLVMAGGPAVFNPEPVADVFDLFLIGDGEEAFLEILEKFGSLRKDSKDKSDLLKEMAKTSGVYVPSLYNTYLPDSAHLLAVKPEQDAPLNILKRVLYPFHEAHFPEKIVVPDVKVIFDRVSVEVARGCSQRCRFCQASSVYFPPRVKSPSYVLNTILNSLKLTGYDDTSLASLSISDYPYLGPIVDALMEKLAEKKISLSLPSLRPKGLSSNIVESIIKVRKTGFTLVPEAGTDRLRRVINKKMEDDDIREASQNAFSQGWRLLKMYFMVGLPTEKDEDLEGIVNLIQEVVRIGQKILKSAPQINLSVSSFIPKPHTPFQWLRMEDESNLREKYRFLESKLRRYPSVKLKGHPLKNAILEAVFSRGDRKLNRVLHQSWRGGARFDSWNDLFRFQTWEKGFEQEHLDYHLYLSSINTDTRLPWDHVDTGVKKSFLLEELNKARKEEYTPSCLDDSCGTCQGCVFPHLLERTFTEEVKIEPSQEIPLGKELEEVVRYRVFYSKRQSARFISHIDVSNIIQRAFRRAGIRVVHTKGFHPKMSISYLPALPLGMEGRAECFEFKSRFLFKEDEFISLMNSCLPSGIRILGLERREGIKSTLNKEIETLVYSVDLKSREMMSAMRDQTERTLSDSDYYSRIEKRVKESLAKIHDESIQEKAIDRKEGKLFLHLKHSLQKSIRPQEIVENIFGLKNPTFIMAREKIVFKENQKN
ncbi:MAG: TIGR03960 family B12-binding radical SAM protein [Candidatus Aminicenantes bacterium]|nr:MAG: TIGR03960 family B12-binding radical SAM protein [Candidatus Aminicenantes bacterium]